MSTVIPFTPPYDPAVTAKKAAFRWFLAQALAVLPHAGDALAQLAVDPTAVAGFLKAISGGHPWVTFLGPVLWGLGTAWSNYRKQQASRA